MKKKQLCNTLEIQDLKNQFTTLEKILNENHLKNKEEKSITIYSTQSIQNEIKINNFYKELHNKDLKQKINKLSIDTRENNKILLNLNREIINNLLIDIRSNIAILNCKLLDNPCSFLNLYKRCKKYVKKRKLNRKKKIELEKEDYLSTLLNCIEELLFLYNSEDSIHITI
jgi:inner membrane protein involved in colicin E2 resistance